MVLNLSPDVDFIKSEGENPVREGWDESEGTTGTSNGLRTGSRTDFTPGENPRLSSIGRTGGFVLFYGPSGQLQQQSSRIGGVGAEGLGEADGVGTVENPMVKGEGDIHAPAGGQLSIPDDRPLFHRV